MDAINNHVQSSTERVRAHRAKKENVALQTLSHAAKVAYQVLLSLLGANARFQKTERMLISKAKLLCPCEERMDELLSKGKISNDIGSAWKKVLQVDLEKIQARNIQLILAGP